MQIALHMRDIRVANAMQNGELHALHPMWEARFIAWVTLVSTVYNRLINSVDSLTCHA
jgi:desulfoferrodoxin (superoxide reductase-like protein)